VKYDPKFAVEGLGLIKPLLNDNNENVRKSASKALKLIVKSDSKLAVEGLCLIKPLLYDLHFVRKSASKALK
jgi:HEAT repeat protein